MKKFTSILLVICILATSLVLFSSCEHKCDFETKETEYDETYHWRICSDEECTEIFGVEEHTFDEGSILTPSTSTVSGKKIFRCLGCAYARVEYLPCTGLTMEEWRDMFSMSNFENFTYFEDAVASGRGVQISSSAAYKFTSNLAEVTLTVAGQRQTETYSGSSAQSIKYSLIKSVEEMLQYSEFEYNEEERNYILDGKMKIPGTDYVAKNATLTLRSGKLFKLTYTFSRTENGVIINCESTITFTNYGTTKI